MRYLILMLFALAVVTGCSDGPSGECSKGEYSDDFTIETQSDIAALAGYTSISRHLTIDCPECTDLSELICLTSVGRDLWINTNTNLTNLDGLNGITSVGWDLEICMNEALTNLDGLSALTSVGGEQLCIYHNYVLPDCEVCDFMDQLATAPTPINVHDNIDDLCTPVPDNCP